MTARSEAAPGRDAFAIACDFAAASGRLAAMGADWQAGQYKAGDLSDAANAIEGLRALLVEFRQGVAR